VAGLVARQQHEDLGHGGVGVLEAPPQLLVEQEAGELGGAGSFKELDEDLAGGAGDVLGGGLLGLVGGGWWWLGAVGSEGRRSEWSGEA